MFVRLVYYLVHADFDFPFCFITEIIPLTETCAACHKIIQALQY